MLLAQIGTFPRVSVNLAFSGSGPKIITQFCGGRDENQKKSSNY